MLFSVFQAFSKRFRSGKCTDVMVSSIDFDNEYDPMLIIGLYDSDRKTGELRLGGNDIDVLVRFIQENLIDKIEECNRTNGYFTDIELDRIKQYQAMREKMTMKDLVNAEKLQELEDFRRLHRSIGSVKYYKD